MTDEPGHIDDVVARGLAQFQECGGDPDTAVFYTQTDPTNNAIRLIIEGRMRALTDEQLLAARIIDTQTGSEEMGDCVFCGGFHRREVELTTQRCSYGQTHEPDCLWVDAHTILNRPLPAGHAIKIEINR